MALGFEVVLLLYYPALQGAGLFLDCNVCFQYHTNVYLFPAAAKWRGFSFALHFRGYIAAALPKW